MFEGLEDQVLRILTLNWKIESYEKNQFVYKIGDQPLHFYLIKSGEFGVFEDIVRDQFQKIQQPTRNNLKEIPQFIRAKFLKKSQKMVCVKVLSEGEFFGHDELIDNCDRKQYVQCLSSTAQLISISAETFHQKVFRENNNRGRIQKIHETLQVETKERALKIQEQMNYYKNYFFPLGKTGEE